MRGPSLPGLSENAMERAYSPWILCLYAANLARCARLV